MTSAPPADPRARQAARDGDAAALAALREDGADLAADPPPGEPSLLAIAAIRGRPAALGVILRARPPPAQLDAALAWAVAGRGPDDAACVGALLAAGASPLGGALKPAVAARWHPLALTLRFLGALAARGRAALRAALAAPAGEAAFVDALKGAAGRTDSPGHLAALLRLGAWAAGEPWVLGRAAGNCALSLCADFEAWAPVARLLLRAGAPPGRMQAAMAALQGRPPFPPGGATAPRAELRWREPWRREAWWQAATPPRWTPSQEAALDAAIAPALRAIEALLEAAPE
jgi:hypothetical protein